MHFVIFRRKYSNGGTFVEPDFHFSPELRLNGRLTLAEFSIGRPDFEEQSLAFFELALTVVH